MNGFMGAVFSIFIGAMAAYMMAHTVVIPTVMEANGSTRRFGRKIAAFGPGDHVREVHDQDFIQERCETLGMQVQDWDKPRTGVVLEYNDDIETALVEWDGMTGDNCDKVGAYALELV